MLRIIYFIGLFICGNGYTPLTDPFLVDTFPPGFMFGTATAAYQVEGAWNVSGKGENIWDRMTHNGGKVANNDTGDVACDQYHKYKDDIQLMKAMGVTHYRFSIGWSRVFPTGKKESYSEVGMKYYKDLVQELLDNGIKPMATLYHWDIPQALEEEGGWLNDSVIGYFEDYADKCFEELGDKVKLWLTFNEPFVFCWLGYGVGVHAPGLKAPGTNGYMCAHNVIRSHAKAYHVYNNTYKPTQKGQCSITLDSDWKEPKTESQEDRDAAERAMQFKLGWFANAIYKNGDYPEIMKTQIAKKSPSGQSRLPTFTEKEKSENLGTYDYFGLNHYTTQLIVNNVTTGGNASYDTDQDLTASVDKNWKLAGSSWLRVVPWGLQKLLKWIKEHYGDIPIIVTENGVSDKTGTLNDQDRIDFYKQYMNRVLKAIKNDNVNVTGYTAWSLLDNFEWASGYDERFGLHYVNFSDPARPRQQKASARYIQEVIKNNGWVKPSTTPSGMPSMTTSMTPSGMPSMTTSMTPSTTPSAASQLFKSSTLIAACVMSTIFSIL